MLAGAKRIIELYDNDEFEIFVINGKNGYGKTSYAHRIISEVYSKDGVHGNWDVSVFEKRIGYHPDRVIRNWKSKRKRDYCYHWDDSGYFLNALDYQDPFVKEVGKYLQTARKKFGCIMFSCIDRSDIVNKIRNFKSAIIIDITKDANDKLHPNRRKATAWHYWRDRLDKVGTENDWEEHFNCHVPDSFYAWYEPRRTSYTKMAEKVMYEKLKKKKSIMKYKTSI
jgi:hypothetical protein